MRDPDRIDDMIKRIRRIWVANPDLRLMQLLENVAPQDSRGRPRSMYVMEDDELAQRLDFVYGEEFDYETWAQNTIPDKTQIQQAQDAREKRLKRAKEKILERNDRVVMAGILNERLRQDDKWGGPEHDDGHVPRDWAAFIIDALGQAMNADTVGLIPPTGDQRFDKAHEYRRRMIQVAALAVAAVESFDRKTMNRFVPEEDKKSARDNSSKPALNEDKGQPSAKGATTRPSGKPRPADPQEEKAWVENHDDAHEEEK